MNHSIHIADTGMTYGQEDGDTLLHSALRHGIGFPYECSTGSCGTCRFELVAGEVRVNWDAAPAWTERDRRKGRYLGCQTSAAGDCTIKVAVDHGAKPVFCLRSQEGLLTEKRFLTHDMAMLTIETPAAAQFVPGQFAMLGLSGAAVRRPYSMANLPNEEGIWQFIVRRTPGGTMSPALLAATPGDRISIDAPLGTAYFRSTAQEPIVCVAGGSGLAPMLAVAKAAAVDRRQVHFFYGGRRGADMTCLPEIEKLGAGDAILNIYPATSEVEETANSWSGRRGMLPEIVSEVLGVELQNHRVYMAGAPGMISAMQTMLDGRGVPPANIHFDRFL